MAVTPDQVRSMAHTFLETLKGMPAKEKEKTPLHQYGDQFNTLLALAKEVVPNVDARLWPKPVETFNEMGASGTGARYGEIETYIRMILNNLPPETYI